MPKTLNNMTLPDYNVQYVYMIQSTNSSCPSKQVSNMHTLSVSYLVGDEMLKILKYITSDMFICSQHSF